MHSSPKLRYVHETAVLQFIQSFFKVHSQFQLADNISDYRRLFKIIGIKTEDVIALIIRARPVEPSSCLGNVVAASSLEPSSLEANVRYQHESGLI